MQKAQEQMSDKQLQPASYGIKRTGLPAPRFYDYVRRGVIPPGVAIRFGRCVYVDPEKLEEFIAAGGQALPGGWRKEAK